MCREVQLMEYAEWYIEYISSYFGIYTSSPYSAKLNEPDQKTSEVYVKFPTGFLGFELTH